MHIHTNICCATGDAGVQHIAFSLQRQQGLHTCICMYIYMYLYILYMYIDIFICLYMYIYICICM
jgi:hypothetical protein